MKHSERDRMKEREGRRRAHMGRIGEIALEISHHIFDIVSEKGANIGMQDIDAEVQRVLQREFQETTATDKERVERQCLAALQANGAKVRSIIVYGHGVQVSMDEGIAEGDGHQGVIIEATKEFIATRREKIGQLYKDGERTVREAGEMLDRGRGMKEEADEKRRILDQTKPDFEAYNPDAQPKLGVVEG